MAMPSAGYPQPSRSGSIWHAGRSPDLQEDQHRAGDLRTGAALGPAAAASLRIEPGDWVRHPRGQRRHCLKAQVASRGSRRRWPSAGGPHGVRLGAAQRGGGQEHPLCLFGAPASIGERRDRHHQATRRLRLRSRWTPRSLSAGQWQSDAAANPAQDARVTFCFLQQRPFAIELSHGAQIVFDRRVADWRAAGWAGLRRHLYSRQRRDDYRRSAHGIRERHGDSDQGGRRQVRAGAVGQFLAGGSKETCQSPEAGAYGRAFHRDNAGG